MTLHRFFLSSGAPQGDLISFSRRQSHQIRHVLRLKSGDSVVVLDGEGRECVAVIRDTGAGETTSAEVHGWRRNTSEPVLKIHLYQAMIKPSRFEMILQKCTEVGVSRFIPVQTARSASGDRACARTERHHTILQEAAEQSRRGVVPSLGETLSFSDALYSGAQDGPVLLLYEGGGICKLGDAVRASGACNLALFVGPEGGFTAAEVAEAQAEGALITNLGARILRSETAAIVASALLLWEFGDLE